MIEALTLFIFFFPGHPVMVLRSTAITCTTILCPGKSVVFFPPLCEKKRSLIYLCSKYIHLIDGNRTMQPLSNSCSVQKSQLAT